MPDIRNKNMSTGLELQPWDKFAAAMKPVVAQFDEILQEHILLALYDRAAFRAWIEALRSEEPTRALILRQERIRGERMRQHIQNAIESLKKAKATGTWVARETEYIREAETLLKRAVDDLLFLKEVRMALVHPQRRNRTEKKRTTMAAPLDEWKIFPGFGKAKVDQMFIDWLEKYLSVLVTKRGRKLSAQKINELARGTFDAAFGEKYTAEHVRSVRRLLAKERLLSGKKQ